MPDTKNTIEYRHFQKIMNEGDITEVIRSNILKVFSKRKSVNILEFKQVYFEASGSFMEPLRMGFPDEESLLKVIANDIVNIDYDSDGAIVSVKNNRFVSTDIIQIERLPEEGLWVDLVIADIRSPSKFYIQLVSSFPELNRMMDDLDHFYTNGENSQNLSLHNSEILEGDLLAVTWTDNMWYRGRVVGMKDLETVTVFYLDYGTVCNVKKCNAYRLARKFTGLPCQALRANLHGLIPLRRSKKKWSGKCKSRMLQLTKDSHITFSKAYIKKVSDSSVSIWLLNFLGDCVNELLVEEGLAEYDENDPQLEILMIASLSQSMQWVQEDLLKMQYDKIEKQFISSMLSKVKYQSERIKSFEESLCTNFMYRRSSEKSSEIEDQSSRTAKIIQRQLEPVNNSLSVTELNNTEGLDVLSETEALMIASLDHTLPWLHEEILNTREDDLNEKQLISLFSKVREQSIEINNFEKSLHERRKGKFSDARNLQIESKEDQIDTISLTKAVLESEETSLSLENLQTKESCSQSIINEEPNRVSSSLVENLHNETVWNQTIIMDKTAFYNKAAEASGLSVEKLNVQTDWGEAKIEVIKGHGYLWITSLAVAKLIDEWGGQDRFQDMLEHMHVKVETLFIEHDSAMWVELKETETIRKFSAWGKPYLHVVLYRLDGVAKVIKLINERYQVISSTLGKLCETEEGLLSCN